jgi:GTP-binding protein LepA
LAACEGAILLVDANSGVQAQTIAHFNHALLSELTIIPALNKIDLKNADPESVAIQMKKLFEIDNSEIIKVSAKQGIGIEELINALIVRIPAPKGDVNKPLKALVFDIWHEKFRGIVLLVRVIDGSLKTGDTITLSTNSKSHTIKEVGILYPDELPVSGLYAGQVGLIVANIHDSNDVNIGDILVDTNSVIESKSVKTTINNIPRIQKAIPMVFASIYPYEKSCYNDLAKAINKLLLNDNGVDLSKESHPALGYGFRYLCFKLMLV